MPSRFSVKFLAIGQLSVEFIIDLNGRAINKIIGGSSLYAAGAMSHWDENIGVLGIIGANFPEKWESELEKHHIDSRGIYQIDEFIDLRAFYSYPSSRKNIRENPVALYADKGLPFPKELLGYNFDDHDSLRDTYTLISKVILEHIPVDYLDASAAHLCPLDITSHIQLTTLLFKGSIRTLTIQPHSSYMVPSHWEDIRVVAKDAAAFITTENEMETLFQGRSKDIWEMMEAISQYGCKFVIVRNKGKGWKLYDSTNSSRYNIQDYPARILDPTGAMDAYCGGFLTQFMRQYDPLRAAIMGAVAVSMKVEGTGPFTIRSCLPGLDQARLDVIQDMVVRV